MTAPSPGDDRVDEPRRIVAVVVTYRPDLPAIGKLASSNDDRQPNLRQKGIHLRVPGADRIIQRNTEPFRQGAEARSLINARRCQKAVPLRMLVRHQRVRWPIDEQTGHANLLPQKFLPQLCD